MNLQRSMQTLSILVQISLLTALLGSCSGPLWQFPGGALVGPESALTAGSPPASDGVLQLETNPTKPYSVNVGFVVIDAGIYIDPAESRTWYQYIRKDPHVRIRFDGSNQIHPALAVAVTDPDVLQRFESDRHVLKLVPRQQPGSIHEETSGHVPPVEPAETSW